jgi:GTPase
MTNIQNESVKLEDSHLRIAVGGNVNSSKSSSVGVLMTGDLDDGDGSARRNVLKLPHEKLTGRSSSVSYNYIKHPMPDGSRRIVTMVDLCGHLAYIRTTLYGITAHRIDYGMVVAGSNMGINRLEGGSYANSITSEHINVLHQLSIPFFIVMSKRDLCTGTIDSASYNCTCDTPKCACKDALAINPEYNKTRKDIVDLLRSLSYQPVWVDGRTTDALLSPWTVKILKMMSGTKFVPIIVTSNKSGFNINLLRNIIVNLTPRVNPIYDNPVNSTISCMFFVEARYWKDGIGLIISGTLRGKTIEIGDKLILGPFGSDAIWHEIRIKGIHNNLREPISQMTHGQTGCLSIACVEIKKKSQLRIGIVAVCRKEDAVSTRDFTAEITVLNHAISITNHYQNKGGIEVVKRYQAVIHCLNIRQAASMYIPAGEFIRSGEKKIVGFKFYKRQECLQIGASFLFCEGKTRGIGKVLSYGLPAIKSII